MTEDIVTTSATTPMSLLQAAVDQNVDVERLDALMKLQERWENNKAIKAYQAAMNACQAEVPIVIKDRQNDFTKAKYATLEAVNHAVKPIWAKHGFSISFDEPPCEVPGMIRVKATVMHAGGHSEEFSTLVPLDAEGSHGKTNKTSIQAHGSTVTYARRYLTLMIFNIAVANEDLDGNPPNATLNDEEINTIKTIVDGCRNTGSPVDMNKFMAVFGVTSIADIPRAKFASAVDMLSKKLASKKSEAARA